MYERLELYIETLTGAAFELRVSPYETVQDIKARIQKLEGIPISQQHLIWQTTELDDECCLSDYSIQDGATLKLVLTMRGGPINTRRIPMDDPTLREMAEYLTEANKEEILEKVSNRPVTVIVYHNGDQFNFFRVVDRESTSPLSESLSGASMYNLYDEDDEEEEEDSPNEEKHEENDKTREKMKLLRMKMDNLTLNKKHVKKKLVPRPPSSGRPSSKTRLRRLPSYSGSKKSASLNRNKCLPPVGRTLQDSELYGSASRDSETPQEVAESAHGSSNMQAAKDLFHSATVAAGATPSVDRVGLGIRRLESVESSKLKPGLSSVKEDQVAGTDEEGLELGAKASTSASYYQSDNCDITLPSDNKKKELSKEAILRRAQSSLKASPKWDFSQEVLLKDAPKPSSPRCREAVGLRPETSSIKGLERLLENTDIEGISPLRPIPPTQGPSQGKAHRDSGVPGGPKEHVRVGSTSRHSLERLHSGGMVLESLHPSEVRAMSGMLSSLVRSASKSRAGFTLNGSAYKDVARIPTPEGRLMSARLQRLSASRDGHVMSPTHRLPPVKQKKKTKRCYICDKKTGLANSYPCRCSHNFCASHRYPEAHSCTFDYKTEGRKLLEQNNPVVNAPKLPKI